MTDNLPHLNDPHDQARADDMLDRPLYALLATNNGSSLTDNAISLQKSASLCPPIAELERAFDEFCVSLFKRKMPRPVITIQTRGRSRMIGWFWEDKWQNGQPKKLPEINIVAEYLAQDVEDIAEVLLHEMVHFSNFLDGIHDCSSAQYHNRKFRDRCHVIGLICEKQGRRGWAYTKLSPALRDIVRTVHLNPEAFQMYRVGPQYTVVETKPEQRQRRWTCQCKKPVGKVIYASRGLDVTCNKCLKVYKENPLV
jgi:hypothetical protein